MHKGTLKALPTFCMILRPGLHTRVFHMGQLLQYIDDFLLFFPHEKHMKG